MAQRLDEGLGDVLAANGGVLEQVALAQVDAVRVAGPTDSPWSGGRC